jgi:hypothetical protein
MEPIRVEIHEIDGHGVFAYSVGGLGVQGRSRQPLLDACRAIKSLGGATVPRQIGLYRPGRDRPDATCSVDWGAAHAVDEAGPKFMRWKPFPPGGSAANPWTQKKPGVFDDVVG